MRSNKREGTKPCHIVSARSREDGYCLEQKAVEEKSNEKKTIQKWCLSMLKLIEIRGTKMLLRRKRFNISFAPAQFIEELMKI